MAEAISSPQPPKYVGNVPEDLKNIFTWAHNWFRVRVMMQRVSARADAIAAVEPLAQTISAAPTQAQVEALQAKINEILTAAQ